MIGNFVVFTTTVDYTHVWVAIRVPFQPMKLVPPHNVVDVVWIDSLAIILRERAVHRRDANFGQSGQSLPIDVRVAGSQVGSHGPERRCCNTSTSLSYS